ncbi:ABC transporter permease [Streptococcus mutans]|jgi:bacteriocin operon protein scnE homolog|uniref:ABC transporter permease n=1 Tax=Streptococcus mutans SM6 TaxID=857119 RepID=A0A829BQ83_STRMG|nr:ABC transporter permease [Streptococcus mutans]EMB74395.1 hypothetical protein SMU41_08449 [Streptococcus mutans 2VS1]EMB95333.1 hypothetical protein SMU61_04515 [Streptococcus mutans G123]EMC06058.1 hypothetical protein SMU69_04160 [Streptococcus mutans NLML4]EMC08606.1 hypothetical protein SMU72_05870 [Streptococcus mutans NLML9]EMC11376.1 hypothetical protein SMU74_05963 [Streptococcus mutans M2A]
MTKAIQVEWLKSKRTKSLTVSTLIILIGVFWSILGTVMQKSSSGWEMFFDNQDALPMFLPLAISIFVSRIISNEKEGRTFKLQASNAHGILEIFHNKLWFTSLFFFSMAVVYTSIISFYITFIKGESISGLAPVHQIVTFTLGSFVQICLYIVMAMIMEKQSAVLATGFLGAFVGIVFQRLSMKFWSFFIPWLGTSFLAMYHFGYDDKTETAFATLDNQIFLKLIVYGMYAVLCYLAARYIVSHKGGELL